VSTNESTPNSGSVGLNTGKQASRGTIKLSKVLQKEVEEGKRTPVNKAKVQTWK